MGVFFRFFRLDGPFDPACTLVSSPFVRPGVLAALRLLLALYALTTIVVDLAHDGRTHQLNTYLPFFTHLSYIGVAAYFLASGFHTAAFALHARKGYGAPSYPLQRWPRVLQWLHVLLFSTIMTFPVIVTVVFWALLASSGTFRSTYNAWNNISVHAMNTGFVLLELFLSNTRPMPWAYLIPTFLLLACYLGVAYITHATQGYYTYAFLDPAKQGGLLAAYIAGIGAACVLFFALMRTLLLLRTRLYTRLHLPTSHPGTDATGAAQQQQNGSQASNVLALSTAEERSSLAADHRARKGARWGGKMANEEKGGSPRRAEALDDWEEVDASEASTGRAVAV